MRDERQNMRDEKDMEIWRPRIAKSKKIVTDLYVMIQTISLRPMQQRN